MAIQILRGTSSQRQSSTQVLAAGQPFYETDTGKLFVSSSSNAAKNLTDSNSFTPTKSFQAASGTVSSVDELPTPQPNTLYKVEYITSTGSRRYDLVWTNRTTSIGVSGLGGKVTISDSGTWKVSDGSPISWSAISGDNLTPPDPMDTAAYLRSAADFSIYFDDTLGVFKIVTTSKTDWDSIEITFAATRADQDRSVLSTESIILPPMGASTTTYLSAALNSSQVSSIEDILGLTIKFEDTSGRLTTLVDEYIIGDSIIQALDLKVPEPSLTSSDYLSTSSTTLQLSQYENGSYIEDTLQLCRDGLLRLYCNTGLDKDSFTSTTWLNGGSLPLSIQVPSTSQYQGAYVYFKFFLIAGNCTKEAEYGSRYLAETGYVDWVQY